MSSEERYLRKNSEVVVTTGHNNNSNNISDNTPSSPSPAVQEEGSKSPSSPKDSAPLDKDAIKLASKAFGYIQRSIELLGKESTRLAGARDFSNTLHWTQAMKFLKERGYIYTKTGHGTSVAEQYGTLEGLEKAFQDQFSLENFPLPRLSKTHLEKVDTKHFFDEASFGKGMNPYDTFGSPFAQYRMPPYPMMPYGNFAYGNYSPDKKGITPPQPVPYYLPNMMPLPPQPQQLMPRFENLPRRVSAPEVSTHLPPGLQALTAAAQSELPISARRSSAPECPFPPPPHMSNSVYGNNSYMKPPMMDQYPQHRNELPSLPPLTKPNPSADVPFKSSNIHTILHMPVQHQPIEPIEPSAHNTFTANVVQPEKSPSDAALLFQNFCDQVQDQETEITRKRSFSLPPMNDLASYSTTNDANKKQKVEEIPRDYYTTSPVVSI